jgi:protein SDA1
MLFFLGCAQPTGTSPSPHATSRNLDLGHHKASLSRWGNGSSEPWKSWRSICKSSAIDLDGALTQSGPLSRTRFVAIHCRNLSLSCNFLLTPARSYKSDFERQYEQYQTLYQIFKQSGSTNPSNLISLRDQIDLISHVCDNYPELTRQFQDDLIELLTQQHFNSDPELREKVISSLVLLRNRGVIDSVKYEQDVHPGYANSKRLLNAFFPLLISTPSKSLRAFLFQKILADIRSANAKTTNHKLNRTLQHTLFNLVMADPTSPKGLWAVKITRELWKRQVWKEAKAVEIMKEAALAENDKVVIGGVRFFLTGDDERQAAEEESSEDDGTNLNALRHQMGINKKSKKRMADLKKSVASVKKVCRASK